MKFEIGRPDYPFKANGKIKEVWIKGQRGRDIQVIKLTMAEISSLHDRLERMRAMPAYYAYDDFNECLWFHPNPNGAYEFYCKVEQKEPKSNTLTLPKKATA
jgi:hypothetical protein